ncbi:MAG: IS30 family transposase [Flavobacteriales bacterium]|nr:IS30 family transposase [Flavobacteriales bacterium]
MAQTVGVSQSTVSRELKRNSGQRGYRHKQAHQRAVERRYTACKATKMTGKLMTLVEQKLAIKWSPEQISGWLLKTQQFRLSHECICLHIWADKRRGGLLYKHLRRQGKRYYPRRDGKTNRGQIKNRVSIEDRPIIVERKARIGDWEIDTVIGKGHSGVLVTLVERVTQFTLSARVANKSAGAVTEATIKLLTPYRQALHTITADNGKEFSYHERMTKALDAEVYFAHPNCSWERGLNENTNGLLRQYWPKSTDFKQVPPAEIKAVVKQLNHRPRKTLGFETPAKLMQDYLAAKAA